LKLGIASRRGLSDALGDLDQDTVAA
jgi:hypothetical protein